VCALAAIRGLYPGITPEEAAEAVQPHFAETD
jgi:hypothetical protein